MIHINNDGETATVDGKDYIVVESWAWQRSDCEEIICTAILKKKESE